MNSEKKSGQLLVNFIAKKTCERAFCSNSFGISKLNPALL
ncbi:hypothetical protein LEP1GSC024_4416 [Leptospira noguchii str. 2001034031]|uniref:Uncharacterized protein n=1 Tax=Leptospira noguchii str. 2001034031 TaxID=1193053 RepID=M6YDX8_9LEPT|nr:hypothetical protein LEP1GSC024_4416 [Leptospira noguchii str. 2001034031]